MGTKWCKDERLVCPVKVIKDIDKEIKKLKKGIKVSVVGAELHACDAVIAALEKIKINLLSDKYDIKELFFEL